MSDEVDIIGLAYEDARKEAVRLKGGYLKAIAPAKVNLYLEVKERREDGYHEVNNVMQTLLLHDTLYLRSLPAEAYALETGRPVERKGLVIHLTCSGSEWTSLAIAPEDNLVYKAIEQLAQASGLQRNMVVDVHIDKKIPNQAGLGGGSSDAAAALVAAAKSWGLAADDPCILVCAQKLGADVPFFLQGGCAFYDGIGGNWVKSLPSRKDAVLLVKPQAGCSTADIYRAFDANPCLPSAEMHEQMMQASEACKVPLFNGLAPMAKDLVPEIAQICTWLEEQAGVTDVLVTGSGSCVYALCDSTETIGSLFTAATKRGWWASSSFFMNVRAACK